MRLALYRQEGLTSNKYPLVVSIRDINSTEDDSPCLYPLQSILTAGGVVDDADARPGRQFERGRS